MKKFLSAIALCTLLGCGSAKQTLQSVQQDSIYRQNIQYDSIFIYRDRLLDRTKDTVFLKETNIEYHYKYVHDTIRMVLRDSIPYPVTVIETRKERYTPWYTTALAWIGGILLVLKAIKPN